MSLDKRVSRYHQLLNKYKGLIIVNPLMTGGKLPDNVAEKLLEEGWLEVGYSLCYDCIEGSSDTLGFPPVKRFLHDVAEFFGGETAEHTFGCRAAQFAVFKAISMKAEEGGFAKVAVVDSLCHYTTVVAAELCGVSLVEVPNTGYPEFKVQVEKYAEKIEEVKSKFGKPPALVVLTHVDPYYGNLANAEEVGRIAESYGIPFMVNAAYTAGVMPVNMKAMKANFLTISAHKSMASLAPLGFLVIRGYSGDVLKSVSTALEWSKRSFPNKMVNLFGCSIGGLPLISAMHAFPYVVERVKKWHEELEKVRWFIEEMEKIDGIKQLGEKPHNHHLTHFETPILWEISKRHKRKGFFLAEELEKRGIIGVQRGLTKHIKISVYGLSWDEIKRVRDVFYEIIDRYTREFNIRDVGVEVKERG